LITGGSRASAQPRFVFSPQLRQGCFQLSEGRAQADTLVKECGESNCHAISSSLNDPASAGALVAEPRSIWQD